MMKKILTLAIVCLAGFSLSVAQADDEKGKGKGKGKPGGGAQKQKKKMDPAKRADMLIKKLDKNDDSKLSLEEFSASPMAKKMTEKRGAEAVGKMFGMRDKNNDGFLDKTELSAPRKGKKGGKGKGKGKGKKGKPEAKKE